MKKTIRTFLAMAVVIAIVFSSSAEAQAAQKTAAVESSKSVKDEKAYTATEIFEKASPAVVEIKITDSKGNNYVGTGFFVGKYNILTNEHVIRNASKIEVSSVNGKNYTVSSVYGIDEKVDLAVLRVKEKNSKYLKIASEDLKVGDTVYSIGSPVGVTGAFLRGMVSNEERVLDEIGYVQLDIASGKGLGGAPVLNDRGEAEAIMCLTVPSANCINMAIKREHINTFLSGLKKSDRISLSKFYAQNKDGVVEPNAIDLFDSASYKYTSGRFEGKYEELTPEQIYNDSVTSMVRVVGYVPFFGGVVSTGDGAGFFIDEDTVITCAHVVKGYYNNFIGVYDYKGNIYEVTKTAIGEGERDLAVLKVKRVKNSEGGEDFVPGTMKLAKNYTPAPGEEIFALGHPQGYTTTLSRGEVMVPTVVMQGIDYIMHSAATSPGNSGGALLNRYGQVIAVTNMLITTSEKMCLAVDIRNVNSLIKEVNKKN